LSIFFKKLPKKSIFWKIFIKKIKNA